METTAGAPRGAAAGVVIVGASLGGLTTAESLREQGYSGPITLIGAENHPPYHRPALSKQVLTGVWEPEQAAIRSAEHLDALDLRLRWGMQATRLDVTARQVDIMGDCLDGSERIDYDQVVIATGLRARRLPNARGLPGVHVLRTLDDVVALRAELDEATRVVVVGTGILGCEVAAALRSTVRDVTVVGRSEQIRFGELGGFVSGMIADLLREHGVTVRLGVEASEFIGADRVSALRLTDGSVIPADVVVVAVGGTPAVEWLRRSGLDLSDGVVCDSGGEAAPGVFAVGDVACWRDPVTGGLARTEHQLNAIEQAQAVAHRIVTGEGSEPIVPFFWSELFGVRILVHGRPRNGPLSILAGDPASGRFVAASHRGDASDVAADGEITGLIGWNMPREFRDARRTFLLERILIP